MSKVSLLTFSAIFLFLYFKSCASSEIQQSQNEVDMKPKVSSFWFGPRVGRRKRNLMEDGYRSDADREDMEELLDLIRKSPWAVVLFNNGRSPYVNFEPKSSSDEEQITNLVQRSMFAPRLGRSMFAPRLGRSTDDGSLD